MTKVFANGNFKEYRAAIENKKGVLIICKSDNTSFGLLIVDPIIFNAQWTSSSMISVFNILDKKEFRGKGNLLGMNFGDYGTLQIDNSEVSIEVHGKGEYYAHSWSEDGVYAITKAGGYSTLKILEIYA